MSLPLILAGPILRRVEPTLVSVWIALSKPMHVQIHLWNDLVKGDEGAADTLFHTNTSRISPIDDLDTTLTTRVGDNLHIAVVTFKLPSDRALLSDRPYSYNLVFTSSAPGTAEDLKSLGLLDENPIDGKENLPLGYDKGWLPSFELPPSELTDLRIVHGSCRRINRDMEDGLAWVDDRIREGRLGLPEPEDPSKKQKRPHQLLLTGDQIYADDVPLPLLPQLIERGRELLGNNEFLPTRWPKETTATYWPADAEHFPPAMRTELIVTEARFTTTDSSSHLISFGEFAAMYLFIYCNALWKVDALKGFDEILAAIDPTKDLPENFVALFKRPHKKPADQINDQSLKEWLMFFFRTLERPELRKALMERDLDGPSPDQKPLPADNLEPKKFATLSQDERNKFKKIYDFAATLLPENRSKFHVFFKDLQTEFGGRYEKAKSTRKDEVEQFYHSLPKVRRALANVPTYMMFDDHDVTDDWNLNPMWRNRVYTSPLGQTLVRNALLAYVLFQGWGNDPVKFESGEHAQLLELIPKLFLTGSNVPPSSESAVEIAVNSLFGLRGGDPPLKWHYSYIGPKHMLLVMDNRTRRSFVSDVGPPGNASLEAIAEQIPAGPLPAGVEAVFVVASLPVIGPPIFDEVIAPLSYRIFDLKEYIFNRDERLKGMPGKNPDAVEAWAFAPTNFEALLKRLEPYRRVIFISGDVHYGSGQFLSYWKKDDAEPARFAQFTSSGLRNVMPDFIRFTDRTFAVAQQIIRSGIGATRLGWDQHSPSPLTLPPDDENVPPILRSKLQLSPVMVPANGWPEGTSEARPPDWCWHAHVVRDERPDSVRPEPTRPSPLPPNTDAKTLEGYGQIAARHAKEFTRMRHGRQIMFSNNLGVIRFEIKQHGNGSTLDVIQDLYTVHPGAADKTKAEPYTQHRITLASLTGTKLTEKRPQIGKQDG